MTQNILGKVTERWEKHIWVTLSINGIQGFKGDMQILLGTLKKNHFFPNLLIRPLDTKFRFSSAKMVSSIFFLKMERK
jgi:hypothetical protein